MVSKCMTLARVQLLGMFGINKALHSKDSKERTRLVFFSIGVLLLALIFFAYSTLSAVGLAALNLTEVIPSLMLTGTFSITLVTTIMKSNGSLFGLRDYDMIMSMPVKSSTVVASRILFLYVTAFLFGSIIMLPFSIVFGVASSASPAVWIMMFLSLFLSPLFPIVIGTALGALITAVSVRFRHKNLVTILLGLILTIGIIIGSMSLPSLGNSTDLTALGRMLMPAMNRIYPLSAPYSSALNNGDIAGFITFAAVTLGAFGLFLVLFSRWYLKINTAVMSHAGHSDYTLGELKAASPLSALYRKELRRYVSSPAYVMNTSIGMVMFMLFSVALLITGSDSLEQLANLPGMSSQLASLAPFVPSFLAALSCTTASALSLEGKNRWIIYSMPIDSITIFNAKILVNLTVLLPAVLTGGILLSAALKLQIIETLLVLTVPSAYAWFISVAGIVLNLKFPNYDYNSDIEVVKRGAPIVITMLIALISTAAPVALIMLLKEKVDFRLLSAGCGILVAAAGCLLHISLKKTRLYLT